MRREHALSLALAQAGHRVEFIERPWDLRDLLRGKRTSRRHIPAPNIECSERFVAVPGHRGGLAHHLETRSVRRALAGTGHHTDADVTVAYQPWSWEGVLAADPPGRRVFDLTDDWAALIPQRADRITSMYARIAATADEVIVVSPGLERLFDRPVQVVPNAVAPEMLETPSVDPPGRKQMIYVGTLSERFDARLMESVLAKLPDWTLDLFGPCRYAGAGDEPAPELMALISGSGARVTWHGGVPRSRLPEVLDRADVLVLPNRPDLTEGQDSMKLYDYAARSRPIVSTMMRVPTPPPPGLVRAGDADTFAEAVASGAEQPFADNRAWAERNGWETRLDAWLQAAQGSDVAAGGA